MNPNDSRHARIARTYRRLLREGNEPGEWLYRMAVRIVDGKETPSS